MRKSKQETAETRQRIVEAASTEFRRNGIDGTGLADLMAAAGMTHGGFYKHFQSKDQVVEESLVLAIDAMVASMENTLAAPGNRGLHTAIGEYLDMDHRGNADEGCPFAALGSDLARSSDAVRESTTAGFLRMADVIAGGLREMPPAAAKKESLFILTAMIGAVSMAQFVTDPDLSAAILRQARKHLTQAFPAPAIKEHVKLSK